MKSSVPVVSAVMTLLPETKSRKYLSSGSYRPHIVVGPPTQRVALVEGNVSTEHYLGVAFVGGPESIEPGQTAEVSFALMYFPQEQYQAVVPGTTFTVREGPAVVGFGTVKHVAQQGIQADGLRPPLNLGVRPHSNGYGIVEVGSSKESRAIGRRRHSRLG